MVEHPTRAIDGNLASKVVEVVVKHTGYPEDFIELDQDLEGELGIDTVKQAEIMADIRSAFQLPVDEDFVLADHPTLNHMIGYIQKMQGGPAPQIQVAVQQDVVAESTSTPPQQTSPPLKQEAKVENIDNTISPMLIQVVVKHTGYPEDFIELDQDLEGELGIDTVKQAEIMAEIRTIFELPVDEDFVLADHPTLNHFIAYINKMKGGSEPTAEPVAAVEPVASVEQPQT
ncbi:MAG: phosphopantetheine-binding protein, partial [Burkholderiaceae bacterium]